MHNLYHPASSLMKVVDVERIICEVPFTDRQARITEREVYTWNVVELCKACTAPPCRPPPRAQ